MKPGDLLCCHKVVARAFLSLTDQVIQGIGMVSHLTGMKRMDRPHRIALSAFDMDGTRCERADALNHPCWSLGRRLQKAQHDTF